MRSLFSLLIIAFTFSLSYAIAPESSNKETSTINWVSIEDAQEKTKKKPRKIMIDLYTDWCGWCKVMDKKTFTNPVIQDYLSKNYYAVKLNAEQRSEILFKGKNYKYIASGSRGYNELAAMLTQGNLSYPTLVFLDENLNVIQPIAGYKDPQNLERIIKFFGEDAHKSSSWENFNKKFKSEL